MKSRTRLLTALTIAVCSIAAFASNASAAPPPNDNFGDAQEISPLLGYFGTNADSTTESSTDPAEATRLQAITGWGFFNTVWHRYDATATGDVSFTVCSNFAFNLLATSGEEIPTLSGTSPAVGPVARQGTSPVGVDDPSGCNAGQYAGTIGPFPVAHGTTIRPVVASAFFNTTGIYSINTTFHPTPVNDDFGWSRQIVSRVPSTGSNRAATVEQDEANNPYTNYRTVWHRYSAIGDGTADIEVCADFPVNLVAYSGWGYPLTPIAQAQQPIAGGCGASRYRVLLDDVPTSLDMPVNIQVGGYSSLLHVGDYDIEVRHNTPPASDFYMGSRNIWQGGGTEYDDNTFAANNHVFNDNPFPTAGKRIHFHAHQHGRGEFSFNTCGTAIDTVSAVYNFPNTYNLWSPDAFADGGCPSGGGDVLPFQWTNGTPGEVAMMQVASKNDGPGGPITASYEWQPEAGNNNFASATNIAAGQSIAGTTKGANSEGAEPNNALGSKHRSVWYRFTAPSNGGFGFDTCDADFDSVVSTWSGNDLGSLTAFGNGTVDNGCESGDGSNVGLRRVSSGEVVYIAVYGTSATERGDFTAELTFEASPSNDNWANATDLGSAETVNLDDDNGWATADTPNPTIGGQWRGSSVWYRWTAPYTDSFAINTCSGSATMADGYLAVFATNDPTPAAWNVGEVAIDDDSCDGNRPKMGRLTLDATAGKTYWISFSAYASSDMFVEFNLRISTPPQNTALPTITGDNNVVGTELTATDGTWGGTTPIDFGYEWLRCETPDDCESIGSASDSTYTLAPADIGNTIRVRVTASSDGGQRHATSANTETIEADTDGDGVGDVGDDCNFVQDDGDIKENGCLEESVAITAQPTFDSSTPRAGYGLMAISGTAENDPGDDSSVPSPTGSAFTWHSCTSPTDEGTCVTRTPEGDNDTYTPVITDIGRYLRVSQVFSNNDGGSATTWSVAGSAVAPPDTDGDGVINDDDNCNFVQSGTVKANGCIAEGIAITASPAISGTAQVGSALTLALGSAENDPGDDSSIAAPTSTTYWYSCSSADNPASCAVRTGSASSYTPNSADIGRFIRSEVEWSNSDSASASTYSAATAAVIAAPVAPDPPATPPTPADPLTLPTFPKKGSFKGVVKKKGAISLPKYKITCAAGSVTCSVTVIVVFKKKTIGKLSYNIAPGTTQPVKTKLSKAGLKLFKKSKKIKAELTVTGSGGGKGKATFKEFTITK